ncbi:hypothetical protein P148_SR1C00001G0563 [candidate division SR1 bacterium RAAC1_SR1_1]|nr:hypothetical protein P148_SR1C00001G0563 [candidate division SR1 bacterium RAAC1_SR1_1]
MRLIIPQSIEKKANEIGLSFDDLYNFIKDNRERNFEKLCAPLPNTIAYKGYIDKAKRLVLFFVTNQGVLYPVYIGDKHDKIAKNITVEIIRKEAEHWHKKVETDFHQRKIKIRHF